MTTQNISRKLAASIAAQCNGTVADSGDSYLTIEGKVLRDGVTSGVRFKLQTLETEAVGDEVYKVPMVFASAPPSLDHREAYGITPNLSKIALLSDDGAGAVTKKAKMIFERILPDAIADFAAFELMRGEGAEQFAAESEATRNALVGVTVAPETNVGLVMVEGTPVEVKVLGSHVKLLGLRVTPEKANAVIAALTA